MNSPEGSIKRFSLLLFLLVWGIYGSLTDLWDQYGYNLMHAGVEAIAERGHFFLEGSRTPKFVQIENTPPVVGEAVSTDTFRYKGRLYPVKQPGMFLVAAVFYKPLSLLGISYEREYNLATVLVSWLTSGLLAAIVVTLLFSQALGEGLATRSALIVALSLGFSSMFFPYSGILHHDLLSSCFLYIAYFLTLAQGGKNPKSGVHFFAGGILAGYAFTTSAPAVLFLFPFAIALVWTKGWRPLVQFIVGYALGVLPLLIYNASCFGNPFLMANRVARDATTHPGLSLGRIFEKFSWYFLNPRTALWSFSPVLYFAFAGLAARILNKKKDAVLLLGGTVIFLLAVFSIPTHGGASFGPRYLLPVLPFLAVGLIPVLKWIHAPGDHTGAGLRRIVWILLGIAFCAGILISFSGAIRGTMYGMEGHPFFYRLRIGMGLSGSPEAPAAFPLLYPIILIASALFYFLPEKILSQKQD